MGSKEGEASSDSQCKGKKQASRSFVRKFKWPENADMEQINADVTNKTLIITMPKLTMKSPEVCKIDMRDGDVGVWCIRAALNRDIDNPVTTIPCHLVSLGL